GNILVDAIQYTDTEDKKQIGIEIHSGRNRIVRRIFEHLGYKVTKLDRVYFAGLTKKNLSKGKWRFLSEKEVAMLKMGAYE
ncbi:MAG: pseudouridine synthase, partial [Marinilabiliales bacterium]